MQLLGKTEKEKALYKEALLDAKRLGGAAFDLDLFNKQWITDHGDQVAEEGPAADPLPRIEGEVLSGDDIPGEDDPKLRAVVAEIVAGIEAYKIREDVIKYSKTKNGTLQFAACLSYVCDNVVKPSRILKREPYDKLNSLGGTTNNNSYNTDYLIKFIDICLKLCGREGLCFNRALYMSLTGVSSEYLRGTMDRLTSVGVNLWQKVLQAEHEASVNFAYNSDIGNMRNLNEGEALIRSDNGAKNTLVAADALRALPMK